MKIGTLFSGIGAWEKALIDLKIDFDLKFFCEVDKYSVKSYCSIFNEDESKNLGDITKVDVDKVDNVDVIFYSPPCQAFSVAGNQKGFEDKRGVLFFDAFRIIKAKMPKIAIMENVKGLTGKKFKEEFAEMLRCLEEIGYTNSWKVLNSKNYGIPQNRERVFVVSILNRNEFEFPEGEELKLRLKDMLEDEVDEKYYVSEEKTRKFFESNPDLLEKMEGYFEESYCLDANYWKGTTLDGFFKKKRRQLVLEPKRLGNIYGQQFGTGYAGNVGDENGISPTLMTMQGGGRQPHVVETRCLRYERTQYGKDIRKKYESGELKEKIGNMRVLKPREDGLCNTLSTVQKDNMLLEGFRIRRLTPTECFRLQGFQDADIQKCIDAGISNTQLYKQAGNSITVTVAKAILGKLFNE